MSSNTPYYRGRLLIAAFGGLLLAGCPTVPDTSSSDSVMAPILLGDQASADAGTVALGTPEAPPPAAAQEGLPADLAELVNRLPGGENVPRGACCVGAYCLELTGPQCSAARGRYLGDGSLCASTNCGAVALLTTDSDQDGCSDLDEMQAGTNPHQAGDCADIDHDGMPNEDDLDVDGDGEPNSKDSDIDGDGTPNGEDADPDGDGKTGEDDPDEDGDGVSDRWDLDDDGDNEPDDDEDAGDDDEDDDDDDDDDDEEQDAEKDRLLDLVERLRTGEITDQDRNAIVNEIVKRLKSTQDQARLQAILVDVVQQALKPGRQVPPTTVPPGVDAVDTIYEQLAHAIESARARQPKPKEPLDPELLPEALKDFMARSAAVVNTAKAFPTLSIDEIGNSVTDLRNTFEPDKLQDLSELIGVFVDPHALGNAVEERKQLGNLANGSSALGKSFQDAEALDLLNAASRLRQRADQLNGTDEEKDRKYQSLLDRMSEVADERDNITDALEQVEQEDDAAQEDDDAAEEEEDEDEGQQPPSA